MSKKERDIENFVKLNSLYAFLYKESGLIGIGPDSIHLTNTAFEKISALAAITKTLNGTYLKKACVIKGITFFTLIIMSEVINIDNL